MTAFLFYILKVIICSALFAGCYWWTLRNGRFYQWNRFYIVSSVALSIIIPLLNVPLSAQYMMPATTGYVTLFAIDPSELVAVPAQPKPFSVSWIWLVGMSCASIAFFLFVKEVISFVRILRLKRRAERIRLPEAVLYCTDDAAAPFTFFRTIFWKKGISVDSGEGRCMFRHELAHVRLGHSWDKALMQLVCCLFWMNPFFMLFRRELELVHEFAADSESIGDGNTEELSSLILCTLYPNHYRDFTSRFFQSNIKRRIFMISKNKKSSMSMLRKMSIIPVALVAMYLFACNNGGSQSEGDSAILTSVLVKEDTQPIGNVNEFIEYVKSKIVYPPAAQENGISGSVIVEFTIEEDGSVTNVKLFRGVDPLLDNELLRVVNSSPKWTPGKDRGKTEKEKYTFGHNFRLNEQTPVVAITPTGVRTVFENNDTNDEDEVLFASLAKGDQPLFDGKDAETAFREWVYTKVVYPPIAQESGIQGRVYEAFTIGKDGSVTNVRLVRGADPLLDNETLRVIKASPKWTPGKKDGKPVNVRFQFQLLFRVNN